MQVISLNNVYSSALRRLVAFIVDMVVVNMILSLFVFRLFGFPSDLPDWSFSWNWHNLHWAMELWWLHVIKQGIIIAYFSLMESSKYQATLGKIALGIKVVDEDNQRLHFSKALLRNLSKLLSAAIFFIGYIMIIFDERKQGLHDKIADTFVVKN
jgi:uncharacterized RDD family membrane protein YckC